MTVNTETAIWERVIEPNSSDLSEEAARFILSLDFKGTDHAARMEEIRRPFKRRSADKRRASRAG